MQIQRYQHKKNWMELEESYQQIIDQKKISLYNLFQHILFRCASFLRNGDQIQNLENKQKKRVLYQNFLQARQLLLRLLVIIRWSQKNISKVQELRDSIVDLGVKLQAFDSSATKLYHIDAAIQGTRFENTTSLFCNLYLIALKT